MIKKIIFYLKFVIQGTNKYNIHSPLVHNFIENVLDSSIKYYAFLGIEHIREELKKQKDQINTKDFGAVAKTIKSSNISIGELTKKVQSKSKKAQLLFRLTVFFQKKNILEIGTSLGLTTSYFANTDKRAKVTTIEADPIICKWAQKNFNKLKLNNIHLINNSFDEILPDIFKKNFDLIFFDGNHSKEATLKYFYWALEYVKEESIFIFDDINWSHEMREAWIEICKCSEVMLSLDLFSLGIVFFKKNRQKEHINLVHLSNFY